MNSSLTQPVDTLWFGSTISIVSAEAQRLAIQKKGCSVLCKTQNSYYHSSSVAYSYITIFNIFTNYLLLRLLPLVLRPRMYCWPVPRKESIQLIELAMSARAVLSPPHMFGINACSQQLCLLRSSSLLFQSVQNCIQLVIHTCFQLSFLSNHTCFHIIQLSFGASLDVIHVASHCDNFYIHFILVNIMRSARH